MRNFHPEKCPTVPPPSHTHELTSTSYQENWTQFFLPPLLPATDPTFGKRALEVLPVFIPVSVPFCLHLETKGTEFRWELQKAAQFTAYGTAQPARGKVIPSPPKSYPNFRDRVFLVLHSSSVPAWPELQPGHPEMLGAL